MPSDPRDYRLELSSLPSPDDGEGGGTGLRRPFVSVHFACCGVYMRIYRSADGSAYRGRCPRCGVGVNFRVGEGGTTCRFFTIH